MNASEDRILQKKVQLFPASFKLHTSYSSLIENPPKGYNVLPPQVHSSSRVISLLRKTPFVREAYHLFLNIFKSNIIFEKMTATRVPQNIEDFEKPQSPLSNRFENPRGTSKLEGYSKLSIALVFAMSKIYQDNLPYVLEILDNPFSIAGYNYEFFKRNKNEIERQLSSRLCKKIICTNTPSLIYMKNNFSKRVSEKCTLVRTGIKKQPLYLLSKKNKSVVKLLFVGSTTNSQDFYSKGGLETVELFEKIAHKRNVMLTIRCRVPQEIADRIIKNKKITLIEKEISKDELQRLYLDSDIFLLPGHHYHLMVMLEAMSYGLPIVALDSYAFSDYVIDDYNGFLIKKSQNIRGYTEPSYPCNVRSKKFLAEIKNIDKKVIDELCNKVTLLIDNKSLREKYGKNSRKLISTRFSIKLRNTKLKNIFDKALQTA